MAYLYTQKKEKISVIAHQVLRISYLVVIISGILLLPLMPLTFGRLLKLILGICSLGLMEIYLICKTKKVLHKVNWAFLMVLMFTILLGFSLPMGIYIRWW